MATEYGPWLDHWPADTPVGSVWEWESAGWVCDGWQRDTRVMTAIAGGWLASTADGGPDGWVAMDWDAEEWGEGDRIRQVLADAAGGGARC